MTATCPVCRGAEVEVRAAYRSSHAIFAGMHRAHCAACGMAFAQPMPSDEVLTQYNASYFSTAHGGEARDAAATAFFSGIARVRLSHVERYLAGRGVIVSSVLELGPGPGYFARSWLEKYPGTAYYAVETDASCHERLRRLGVHLQDVPPGVQDASVDLVVMSHVLEHVADPVGFLAEATRPLRRGGVLFIEVPCRDYEHKSLDEPHVLFFDKAPMRHLLVKSGFEDMHVTYHGVTISDLHSLSPARSLLLKIRGRLIRLGLIAPFARGLRGMESLTDPAEHAAVAPFRAHVESSEPAWWLRALAIKL